MQIDHQNIFCTTTTSKTRVFSTIKSLLHSLEVGMAGKLHKLSNFSLDISPVFNHSTPCTSTSCPRMIPSSGTPTMFYSHWLKAEQRKKSRTNDTGEQKKLGIHITINGQRRDPEDIYASSPSGLHPHKLTYLPHFCFRP